MNRRTDIAGDKGKKFDEKKAKKEFLNAFDVVGRAFNAQTACAVSGYRDILVDEKFWKDIRKQDSGENKTESAEAILREKIPLRGKEVQFLRKVAGLSMEKFANKLGLTSGTVFHWEKNSEERLLVVNEIAVKSLIADLLDIEISGKLSDLIGDKIKNIVLKAA